ncbi:MAG: S8 family serine peptidase, partial [Elusimicrobia bacterium]|nr:S8 family serine peptidase [Elusimicrobiota bacterium]
MPFKKPSRLFVFPAKTKISESVHALASVKDAKKAHEVAADGGLDPAFLAKHKARVRQTHKRINCAVIEAPQARLASLKKDLEKQGVKTAPVKPVYLLLHQSVPLMQVPEVWNAGFTGKGILVGVVDSGIDVNHPDFAGRIQAYKDFTRDGLSLRAPTKSGRGNLIKPSALSPKPFPPDKVGHGTHVAGIIAGAGLKYRGAAPQAGLLIAKVFDKGGTTDDIVLAGLSWAAYSGAQVINLSLGGPGDPDDVLSKECDELMKEGI